jgi:hypothetical protein
VRECLRVRELSDEESNRLLRIVRRSSGSVVTWRRAQMVLLSAQRMNMAQIAGVGFTSRDRVRAVITPSTRTVSSRSTAVTLAGARLSPRRAQPDKESCPVPPRGPRPTVLHLEPGRPRQVLGRRGGGRRH